MKTRKRSGRARNRCYLEALEGRALLSGVPAIPSRWVIQGTDADDVISVVYDAGARQFKLTINGVATESRSTAQVRSIVISGKAGNDVISVDLGTGRKVPVVINGDDGNDTLTGGIQKDVINGGAGDDTISGGGGSDILHGNDGKDILNGDAGADAIYGDGDNDNMDGGDGGDELYGKQGDDVLIGGAGRDKLHGGRGSDTNYSVKGRDTCDRDVHDSVIRMDEPNASSGLLPDTGTGSPLPPVPISDELRQRIIEEAVARYKSLFGTTYSYPYYSFITPGGVVALSMTSSLGETRGAGAAAGDHSDTNTQVQGVDEADLVETDGNFIYTVRNNQLIVIDVRDPKNAHIASTLNLDQGFVMGMYLLEGRLVVLTSSGLTGGSLFSVTGSIRLLGGGAFYVGNPSESTVWVFDTSDPENLAVVEKTTLSGSIASSRMIGDQLYLVMNNSLVLPPPQTTLISDPGTLTLTPTGPGVVTVAGGTASSAMIWYPGPRYTQTYQYATEEEYRQWVSEHLDEYLPRFATTLSDGTAGPTGSLLGNIAYDSGNLGGITSVVNFDVSDDTPGPSAIVTVTASASIVYASTDNLYVCSSVNMDGINGTRIMKFNLGAQTVHYAGAASLPALVGNSYAMDEYNGNLRVVTGGWGWGQNHNLYVLSEANGVFSVKGAIAGIGDGEALRAVRFVEDRAFVVTFRQVDPLFAIDLSDPAHPQTLGELVIPGFSTYLYAVDRNHLIGIGQGVGGEAGSIHNVQVSLFDVSDMTHPKVVDQDLYQTGNWGSVSSAAQYDPHAFSYFADQDVLAVPLSSYDWTIDSSGAQNALLILKVNEQTGFQELGRVVHDSDVQRSVRIGNNLYSLAQNDLKIVELLHPSHEIAEVTLPSPPVFDLHYFTPLATVGGVVS